MKKILGLPILHVKNVGEQLLPTMQKSIDTLQSHKEHWDRQKSKLSVYTESGEHKFKLKQDPMEGVEGWQDLRKIIKGHVMDYFTSTQPIDEDFQSDQDRLLRDELDTYWHSYAWYTYFDERDSYSWHAHGQYYLIATYYVRAEEEHAPLQFKSPLSDMYTTWALGTKATNLEETIQPETGDLIIWPAWLEHQVPSIEEKLLNHSTIHEINKYKEKRISITNCYVKPHAQFLHTQRNKDEQE